MGERVIADLATGGQAFSIGIAALPRLDQINRQYGAHAGDLAVGRFAASLRAALPAGAFLARWGGPAFVAVLREVAADHLRATLSQTLDRFGAEVFETGGESPRKFQASSRYAVHQWTAGEPVDKICGWIDTFCLSNRLEAE